jgi:Heterokaryon incompatibility protein (HET)
MNQLKYKPLDPGQKEIRLIEILSPGTETSPAECRLSIASLLGNISFAALSYAWGDSSVTENIALDGSTVPVTANLAAALRHVKQHWQQQYPDRDPNSFRLWVDAISINQKDIQERNQQVQLMGSIYSQAELVLSWLGSGHAEMCLALQTFDVIAQEVKGIGDGDLSFQWMEKYPLLCVQDIDPGDDGLGNKAWMAMWHFFDLSYWYRVWIFQELVLARNLLLIYGSESLRYEDLEAVCAWSRRVQCEGPRQLYQLPRPRSMSDAAWKAATGPYLDWYMINKIALAKKKLYEPARRWNFLLICRSLRATDPKDHIYGLLGILEEGLEAKITPDYEKTVGEVYCEAICHWVEEEQDLLFLYLAGIGRFDYDPGMPSWTPNFIKASEIPNSLYITAGCAEGSTFENNTDRSSVSQSTLQAIGLEIDRITRVEEAPKLDTWADGRMLQYCIDFASRAPVYVTGVPPLQAIFHVLMRYEASEEGQHHLCLLALGFLRYVLFISELNVDPLDRFQLLGLSTGKGFPESFEEKVFPGCDFLKSGLPNLSTEFASTEGPLVDAMRSVMQTVVRYNNTFRFIETPTGYLGLAPNGAAIGDILCVLKGCDTPVILRKVNEHYVHVGTCFALGLMDGEAAELLKAGRAKVQRFEIQ